MIDPTSSTTGTSATTAAETSTVSKTDIGKDAFLQLLVIQLRNQDPTNPQSNQEFLAQLATFSSLEQLTSINKAVTSLSNFFEGASNNANKTDTSSGN